MSKYVKTRRAGRYCMAVAYTRPVKKDNDTARGEKKKHSTKARQLLNDKASRLQLTAIIAENFMDSDTAFFVTPSFDCEHYPEFRKQSEYWNFCCKEAKLFLERLRRLAKKRGDSIRSVFCPGIGEGGRWHLHILVDGCSAEDLRDTWGRGGIDYHRLTDRKFLQDPNRQWYDKQLGGANPIAIAKYMMRNAACRQLGKHPWHASRSCKRPTVEPARVMQDKTAILPDYAILINLEENNTMYSSFSMVEYILPKVNTHRRPLA